MNDRRYETAPDEIRLDHAKDSTNHISWRKLMSERVGFIGLGIMGQGMAHNLLKAGSPHGVESHRGQR